MSEPNPSPAGPDPAGPDAAGRGPQQSRWVRAKVVGEEPDPAPPPIEDGPPIPVPDQSPVTEEEIQGARWFAIAFLVLVIPLGLALLAMIVWYFVQSVRW